MSNLQTREAALKAADHLAESLDENTRALEALDRRVTRRTRWIIGFLVAVVLTFGLSLKFNYDANVSRCEGGNELREEIDERFQSVADSLVEAGVEGTPEGRALLVILSADLNPRDCSKINWLGKES